MELFKTPNINFIGNRNKAFIFSGILIVISFLALVIHGGFNMSIDFVGGTMVQFKFEKPVMEDIGKIRTIVSGLNLGQPEVKTIGAKEDNEIQIIVKKKVEGALIGDEIKTALQQSYPDNPFEIRREERVGPKISSELATDTLWALLLSFLVIIVYIAIRFQLPFGVAAVIALVHDTVITLGVFAIFDAEVSLAVVAALLTIIGYSLNDTIVVFDRIRENLGKSTLKTHLEDRINTSINETLSRTIITGGTTMFSVLAIYGFFFSSGDVLKYFAGALLVGMVIGTYSSVYVASPFLILWNKRWPLKFHGSHVK